jgi:CRP/FNR family transcriptional regulator, anaerobic regulatory protein
MDFINTLVSRFGLSSVAQSFLAERLHTQQMPKKAILLSPGQVCGAIYFIESGLVRAFYIDEDGQDITTLFADAGDFLYSPRSFLQQQPATEFLEVLEKSVVVTIPLPVLTQLYNDHPETNRIGRLLTEQYLLMYDDRVRNQRTPVTPARIRTFMNAYPDIFNRASNSQIASYLGTSRESISRFLSDKEPKL